MAYTLGQEFYRIVDTHYESSQQPPVVQKLYAAKLTAKGAWLVWEWSWRQMLYAKEHGREEALTAKKLQYYDAHLVIENTGRKFAYPDIEGALHSYKRRKERQIMHARHALQRAQDALEWIKLGKVSDGMVQFDQPEEMKPVLPWPVAR